MFLHIAIVYSFLLLTNSPWYEYSTVCLTTHSLKDICVISNLEYSELSCYDHSCMYRSALKSPRDFVLFRYNETSRSVDTAVENIVYHS